ncbi:MAG TPA: tRNA (adenosine(37)-N6)-threonylcarbamoyltransferase complex dimerization subunit type 1 TsaB [Coxiellaceae bacterium]|nr:tRNA (adenosine(37)-N6)-threonylcarbamoyltransferase complex dimerization subunit type 1 TsaB [Coxiellaceae bacterium]
MLKILSFDTSTEMCSAALKIGEKLLARQHLAPQKHAELLLPMISELLIDAQLGIDQLDAIAFGQGPGSFMGLRIGVGVVQGLAYGANKPVIAVSSLQAIAQTAYERYGITRVAASIDARMQALYWGLYELDEHKIMQAVRDDSLIEPQALRNEDLSSWVAAGQGWQVYANEHALSFAETYSELYPMASAMLDIATYKFKQQEFQSAEEAEPYYLRNQVVATKA